MTTPDVQVVEAFGVAATTMPAGKVSVRPAVKVAVLVAKLPSAIVKVLGTPISTGQGKDPISELEFHAQTYGDIEDVMAAPDGIQQTVKLIALVAKPLGSSLTALPSWAINLITVTDGITIQREILPRFLGSPDE